MRNYEVIFILKPDMPEAEADSLIAQMEGVVTATGGTLEKTEKMGRRRLAYRIQKYVEGHYVLFVLEGEAATVQELERRLKVSEPVLKYLTVRVDEERKRLRKMQQFRAKRAARKRSKASPEAAASAG